MKPLLNTLYVTSEDAWIRKDGLNIVVEADGRELGRAPLHILAGVVCLARAGASPAAMAACAEAGVALSFHTPTGRFLARVEGADSGNVLLRRAQHRATESAGAALPVARAMVAAKAANQRALLRRAIRDHGETPALDDAERRITAAAGKALHAENLDVCRGLEGEAAQAYFGAFGEMLRRREPELRFKGRSRRPPLDPPNAVLSFLYALLTADCRAAALSVGLDPQMGFLHRDRPGRPSLALDLAEEFRAPLADRVCLALFNRRQLKPADFIQAEDGGCRLVDDARRTVLVAYQARKRTEARHPFLEERAPLGLGPFLQAQLLARHLRGDLDGYPAFVER